MDLKTRIVISLVITYSILAVYISSSILLGFGPLPIASLIAVIIALAAGASFFLKYQNLPIPYGASILFVLINAFPAFIFELMYVCGVHGLCL